MLDELFERLVGTLRLAVQVYVELRATDNDLNRAMKSLARSHKAVLTDIRPFAPADAFGGPAPLEDELDDWRMLDAVRLVDALESELLEIADELYWSTAPTAVKRALETLIDASSEMLEQLERIEARAHRDHRSPPDGEGDMFDRQFKRGHIRGSEPDNPVDGEDGDYEDGASDDAGPGDGSVDADRSNPGGLGGVHGHVRAVQADLDRHHRIACAQANAGGGAYDAARWRADAERLDRCADMLRAPYRLGAVTPGQANGKFLAPQATADRVGVQRFADSLADRLQHRVTGLMAMIVVELFEMVDVDQQIPIARLTMGDARLIEKGIARQQPGQPVNLRQAGQFGDALLQLFAQMPVLLRLTGQEQADRR